MTATPGYPVAGARRLRHPLPLALGAVAIVVGLLAAAAGIGLLATFGTSGELRTGRQEVSTNTAAVVTDVAQIQNTRGVATITGAPSLRVSAVPGPGSAAVFVGIARAADVDRYLAGVDVDEVTDLTVHPFHLTMQRHSGTTPAAAPGDQSFWVATAESPSRAELTWPVQDGSYRLVVMNASGAAGVDTRTELRVHLPHAFTIALSVVAGGVFVTLLGTGVVVFALVGGRRDRDPMQHSSTTLGRTS